ncbi:MAG: RNA polymerase subunit sigma-24, partial [Acidimicrobiia bacterium]
IFNEGYFASSGDTVLRDDLASSAIDLGKMLVELMPDSAEAAGLLALMLLHHSRRFARVDEDGDMVLLQDQDRAMWNRSEIQQGLSLISRHADNDSPYVLQAAIAGCHATAESWDATDWSRIVALYDRLVPLTGSPVVSLNRAVAVGHAEGPEAGLAAMAHIDLDGYHAFHASRGELLRRAGRQSEARRELERALQLSANDAERRLIESRLGSMSI